MSKLDNNEKLSVKNKFLILITAGIMVFLLRDAVYAVASFFVSLARPQTEITIRVTEPIDGHGQYVMLFCEGKPKELFEQFKTSLENRSDETGWKYECLDYQRGENGVSLTELSLSVPGTYESGFETEKAEAGVSWIRLVSAEPGSYLTIKVKSDPEIYFAAMASPWNSAFEYTVKGKGPIQVDCYSDDLPAKLIRVFPIQENKSAAVLLVEIALYVLVFLSICFILGKLVILVKDEENRDRKDGN